VQQRTGAHDYAAEQRRKPTQRRTSTCSGAARYHSKHSVHIPTGVAQRRSGAKQVRTHIATTQLFGIELLGLKGRFSDKPILYFM